MTPPDPMLHPVPPTTPLRGTAEATPPARRPSRQRALLGAAAVAAVLLVALGARAWVTRGDESTDDAFVEADVVALSARVAGPVAEVLVADDAHVRRGQPLVRIDEADYALAVRRAEAELETARAQALAADAQVRAARATVTRAQAEAERAAADLRRAEELKAGGVLPPERYDATRATATTTSAGEGADRARFGAALADAALAQARVKGAEAALDLARLHLAWTTVVAPADGTVSRVQARVGEVVQPGQPFAQLVPDTTYVVANLKETQTGALRPGERADVTIDAYAGRHLEGRVEAVAGGTGARFALLPPDNASGNYVKVVERVPVRIAWVSPPTDLPLRAGLSATVTIHTR